MVDYTFFSLLFSILYAFIHHYFSIFTKLFIYMHPLKLINIVKVQQELNYNLLQNSNQINLLKYLKFSN